MATPVAIDPDAGPESPDDSAQFSRRLNRTTYSPVVSLGCLVGGLLVLVMVLLWTMRWLDHSNVVIQKGLSAQKLILEIQSSVRGYYLSGDATYLDAYRVAQPKVGPELENLRAAVADNPNQAKAAEQIRANADAYLTMVATNLSQVDPTAGEKPSPARMASGKAAADELGKSIELFLANEYDLSRARSALVRLAAWWALGGAAVGTALVAYIQCRGMRRRLMAITETYRGALRVARERRARISGLLKELDEELKAVGEIQRSLLPMQLPKIHGLEMAAAYQTSRRAGGDYYDFFLLPPEHPDDDRVRYGILIADVSGHGTPAAVLMAVTHSIAHGFAQPTQSPDQMLSFVNKRLCAGYTTPNAAFVTAFYAIYDPRTREIIYSCAGHNPPRLRRAGEGEYCPLDDAQSLPLGVSMEETYETRRRTLRRGDTLVLYTDGITEARNGNNELLGTERLDQALLAAENAPGDILDNTLKVIAEFDGNIVYDDRTMLVLRVLGRDEDEAQVPVDVKFADLSNAVPTAPAGV